MRKRIVLAVVLDAVAILVLAYSHTPIGSIFFLILLNSVVAAGLCEFYTIVEKKGSTSLMAYGVIAGIVYCTMSFFISENPICTLPADFFDVTLVVIIIGFFIFQLLRTDSSSVIHNLGGTVAGMFYVAWLLAFAAKINYYHGINGMGMWYIILLVLISKGGDAAAYLVGSKIGRRKLCPNISPKKTFEGALAHLIIGVAVAVIFKFSLFYEMTFVQSLAVGILLSIIAQFGDIIESMLKRDAGVKDSGKYFKELGGVLDLIDSVLLSLPLLYYLMRFWLEQ